MRIVHDSLNTLEAQVCYLLIIGQVLLNPIAKMACILKVMIVSQNSHIWNFLLFCRQKRNELGKETFIFMFAHACISLTVLNMRKKYFWNVLNICLFLHVNKLVPFPLFNIKLKIQFHFLMYGSFSLIPEC